MLNLLLTLTLFALACSCLQKAMMHHLKKNQEKENEI